MPTYSVITPLYNVAAYLPDFLRSLLRQSIGFDRLQVILVDDGSTDDGATASLAREFADAHPDNVVFLAQPNGGQASARNLGLSVATGEWLTFPDPDDVLGRTYFAELEKALARVDADTVDAVSARILLWYGRERGTEPHALDGRFHHGMTLRHLDTDPDWIQPHATSALIRRSIVERFTLRFPEELRVRFEDAAFLAEYLLRVDDPVVLFVPAARYLYRQRADQSSTIQSTRADPRKYVDHLRHGFPCVIDTALRTHGRVPRWAQNLMLYDQFWILLSSQSGPARNGRFPEGTHAALRELVPAYLEHIDVEAIRSFGLIPVEEWMRDALVIAKGAAIHGDVAMAGSDRRQGLRAYVYRHGADAPREDVLVNGRRVQAHHVKTQGMEYVGRPIVWERTLWLPDEVEPIIVLDGRELPVRRAHASANAFARKEGGLAARAHAARFTFVAQTRRIVAGVNRRRGRIAQIGRQALAMRSPRSARRFRRAWVFIDRDVDANDSGEDMYFWVRENHPEINAWFVVTKGTPDWERLAVRGARLVGYGEPEFFALLAHADHYASSHADRFITDVLPKRRRSGYTFTFLQHGVIKGDISDWLNKKHIDVFVTSTEAEYDYITDSSPYKFGTKEVRLTGLPRHDVLRLMRADGRDDVRRTVLIMPTWRDYLVGEMTTDSGVREHIAGFATSAYARSWAALLADPRTKQLAGDGYDVVFMPHPNMRAYLPEFVVPDHVRVLSYADANVRELLADAAALLTDYSSMAFNAAYLRTPVVYFQFDRDEYRAGHTERDGYFDYEAGGFGPVHVDAASAARALADAVLRGAGNEYSARMAAAFPVTDGKNRERVFQAMVAARTRKPLAARLRAAAPDRWKREARTEPQTGS